MAQEGRIPVSKISQKEPVEVVIKGPMDIRIVEWRSDSRQPIRIKFDEPWPARIAIDNEVKVKGELRMAK